MNLVKDVMINDSSICTTLTSVDNIMKMMNDFNRKEIYLVDTLEEKHLLGAVNEKDILKLSEELGVPTSRLNTEQCMTDVTASVGQNASMDECVRVMDYYHLSRIPVVDEENHCCGVVDFDAMELTTI